MKKVYIIHGWGGNPNETVLVWLDEQLSKRGFEVIRPSMPNPTEPAIDEWVSNLKNLVVAPNEDSYFIGHSIGCQAIMRYFETLPENTKVGGALFLAGWFFLEGLEDEGEEVVAIGKPWIETPIDFEKIKAICQNIVVFLSSDEPYGFVEENKKLFVEKLDAKVTILENKGHISESDGGITELPEALIVMDELSAGR